MHGEERRHGDCLWAIHYQQTEEVWRSFKHSHIRIQRGGQDTSATIILYYHNNLKKKKFSYLNFFFLSFFFFWCIGTGQHQSCCSRHHYHKNGRLKVCLQVSGILYINNNHSIAKNSPSWPWTPAWRNLLNFHTPPPPSPLALQSLFWCHCIYIRRTVSFQKLFPNMKQQCDIYTGDQM